MHSGCLMGAACGLMWIWPLLFLVVGLLICGAIMRSINRNRTRDRSPEEILKELFVRGEIDQEQFRERLAQLRK